VKLYAFDGVDEQLELVPLAARRALDATGLRLSRAAWTALSLADRRALVELGSAPEVERERVKALCGVAGEPIAPSAEPPSADPPADVVAAFGPEHPIPGAVWSALSPLDRYALAKVAAKARPERISPAHAEIVGASTLSTHLAPQGGVRMVNVGQKAQSLRTASAESRVTMSREAFERLENATAAKGDVLGTARLAGIMGAKRTHDLIPLCHALSLTHVGVELELERETPGVRITSSVETFGRTGVEMEALVAANVAALTVYDMLKAYDRGMEIGPTRLLSKSGGRSGDFRR
jgi:cyclic pyranopterin phosphate synthase